MLIALERIGPELEGAAPTYCKFKRVKDKVTRLSRAVVTFEYRVKSRFHHLARLFSELDVTPLP